MNLASLTRREREVFVLFLQGLSQKEIGFRTNVSAKTVWSYMDNLRHKLHANDVELVKIGIRSGLTEL